MEAELGVMKGQRQCTNLYRKCTVRYNRAVKKGLEIRSLVLEHFALILPVLSHYLYSTLINCVKVKGIDYVTNCLKCISAAKIAWSKSLKAISVYCSRSILKP